MHGCAVEKGDSEAHPLQNSASGSNSVLKLPTPRPETLEMGGAAVKALQIIDAARAVGVTLSIDGDSLLLRSGSPPPQEVLDALTRHKGEVINFLQSGSQWLDSRGLASASSRTGRQSLNSTAGFLDKRLRRALSGPASSSGSTATRSARRRTAAAWCGGGEREDNVLLPFGIERAGHAWMHSRCWRPWHEHRQAQAIDYSAGARDRCSD